MNHLGFRILIPFSKNVALSSIVHLLVAIASTSRCSISITLRCAFAIVCTCVAYYTFNCTCMDSCFSFATMLSSPVSFYIVYDSTKWCSSTSSSSDSSMHTISTNVVPSLVYSFAHQRLLLLRKKSTTYVLIIFMFWIIICANCIFSLYAFLFAHFENDDECNDNLIANDRIFNTPSLSTLLNSSFTSILLNNSNSSSYLCLYSFFCVFFPLLFLVVSQWHSLHSCYCEFQNFENMHNFSNKHKLLSTVTPFFLSLNLSPVTFIFFTCPPSFN